MKHLKKFNESVNKSFEEAFPDEVYNNIKDILSELDLNDIVYTTKFSNYFVTSEKSYRSICVDIKDVNDRYFKIGDIKDVLLRLYDYLGSYEIEISYLYYEDDVSVYTLHEFIEEFKSEELYGLSIHIYKL